MACPQIAEHDLDPLGLALTTVGNMGLNETDILSGKGCPASIGDCGNTTYVELFGTFVAE